MRRLWLLLCTSILCAACSGPPQKEIDRAQGALDAARAAGAEQYATEPFTAATTALKQAHEAVDQRDYRLALSRALDASERAQDAARQSADGKARARTVSEQAVNATASALQQLEGKIKSAAAARLPPHDLSAATRVAKDAAGALQKARADLRAGNYLEASASLKAPQEQITAETRRLEDLIAGRAPRPPRRKK